MKAYIISVAGAAVISAAVNMLSPEKWTKYISIITGLVVAIAIGRPVFELINKDVFSELRFGSGTVSSAGMTQFYDELRNEMEKRVCEDIRSRLSSEFGADCEVDAEVKTDQGGRIEGIGRVTIYGMGRDNIVIGRLREIYDMEEVVFGGDKKLYQKAE